MHPDPYESENVEQHTHFVFIITNCPSLLSNTLEYQQGMIINDPNISSTERSLYLQLFRRLQAAVNDYLRQTQRPIPVHLVFDFSQM